MAICKQCGASFPYRYIVDGVEHNAGRRKFCYNCHPMRKDLPPVDSEGKLKGKCQTCGREYIYKKNRAMTMSCCNSCMVNKHRHERKRRCLEYKGNKCQICGYDKCAAALTFHHRDPDKKLFLISGSHARNWEAVRAELDKCDLLCQNCHHELHVSPGT